MKRLRMSLKKNQIIVFVIGLMIITAGYLSYSNNENSTDTLETGELIDSEEMASIGDAQLVSANVVEEETSEEDEEDSEVVEEAEESDTEEASESSEETSTTVDEDDYFTNSRLERNAMYSQSIETYQEILSNTNASETQKQSAEEEIEKLNNEQNAIMIAENLIKTKGIEDLVIFVNNDNINVIVKGDELTTSEVAQIQNIITRELEADISDIHIMCKE